MVPEAIINDFATTLGIEVEGAMDIDGAAKLGDKSFGSIQGKVKELMREGYSATQILSQVCRCNIVQLFNGS